jgi:hypothetical protein
VDVNLPPISAPRYEDRFAVRVGRTSSKTEKFVIAVSKTCRGATRQALPVRILACEWYGVGFVPHLCRKMLRKISPAIVATVFAFACSASPNAPTSAGKALDVAGAWSGTFSSSNNPEVPMALTITQNGSTLTGTWQTSVYQWTGELTASVQAATISGKLAFRGTASDGTNCSGSADFSGSVTASAISLTSETGVVGASCPAPLPVNVKIDLHR